MSLQIAQTKRPNCLSAVRPSTNSRRAADFAPASRAGCGAMHPSFDAPAPVSPRVCLYRKHTSSVADFSDGCQGLQSIVLQAIVSTSPRRVPERSMAPPPNSRKAQASQHGAVIRQGRSCGSRRSTLPCRSITTTSMAIRIHQVWMERQLGSSSPSIPVGIAARPIRPIRRAQGVQATRA